MSGPWLLLSTSLIQTEISKCCHVRCKHLHNTILKIYAVLKYIANISGPTESARHSLGSCFFEGCDLYFIPNSPTLFRVLDWGRSEAGNRLSSRGFSTYTRPLNAQILKNFPLDNRSDKMGQVYHHQIGINDGGVDIETCRSKAHSGKQSFLQHTHCIYILCRPWYTMERFPHALFKLPFHQVLV